MNRLRWAPAGMHGFDDTSYHLSAVATWIRSGDLRMIRFSMGDPSTPFYPVLGEISSWVLIAPFHDSDVAARWTQLFFSLFSFLAVAAIARRLGLSRRSAALAAVAYAGIPHIFPILAVAAGNDPSTAFFTLAGIDAALALARRPGKGTAVTAGTALGLLLATKYIGVLFAPVILAMLALAAWIERRRREPAERPPVRRLAILAALLAATMAITGGYTYARNAATTGNPIFPAPVTIGGVEILPGWWGETIKERSHEPAYRIEVWPFLTRRSKLFGSYFPFTLLPAALLAPFLALRRRRWLTAMTFLLAIAFFLQFLYLMQDHRDIRYFLPAIALAAVAFAWLLEAGGPRVALPIRGVLLAWIFLQGVRRIGEPYAGQIAIAAAMLIAAWLLEIAWRRRSGEALKAQPLRAWAAAALVAAAAMPLGWVVTTYQTVKLARQPAAQALDRLVGPNGAHVAYAGYNQPYLFFGSRFQNDLEIVPRNRSVDSQYYRWGTALANPYVEGSYSRWRGILEDKGIEWIVTVRSEWEDPEHRWVSRRTEDFALAYQDPGVEIWRVLESR
jgi:4-amino-4-deoxy-L-arabinose transferase-like glycosyltransferase